MRGAAACSGAELDEQVAALRDAHLEVQRGLVGSAVDDFFLYDEVLETAMMLGLVPDELASAHRDDPFGLLTALARGTPQREAWEMTKWFDTNYHFVVPVVDRLPQRAASPPVARADRRSRYRLGDPRPLQPREAEQAHRRDRCRPPSPRRLVRPSGPGHATEPPRLRASACSSTSRRSGWR